MLLKILFIIFVFKLNFHISEKTPNNNIKKIEVLFDTNTNTIIYNGDVYVKNYNNTFEINNSKDNKILNYAQISITNNERKLPLMMFLFYLISFMVLAAFAGCMSGLTVGMLSIDPLILEIKESNGSPNEKKFATNILKIVSNHHWLLVTLLLCNSFACEAMPIVLDKLVSEAVAIVLSVTVLLFVGEIIPQALCTGPNQIEIANFFAPFTYILMIITFPISYPIAVLMDKIIGVPNKNRYCNKDLRALINLHASNLINSSYEHMKNNNNVNIKSEEENLLSDNRVEFGLSKEQVQLMMNSIDIKDKKAIDFMTPFERIVTVNIDSVVNSKFIENILSHGYSRYPVYSGSKNNIVGILRIKQLLGINLSHNILLTDKRIKLSTPLIISPEITALDLLNEFKKGRSHMAFFTKKENVKKLQKSMGLDTNNSLKENSLFLNNLKVKKQISVPEILGIITLEDLIEGFFDTQISDEDDYIKDKKEELAKKLANYTLAKSGKILNAQYDNQNKYNSNKSGNNLINNEPEINPYIEFNDNEDNII